MTRKRGFLKSVFWQSKLCSWLFQSSKRLTPKTPEQRGLAVTLFVGLMVPVGIYWHQISRAGGDVGPNPEIVDTSSEFICELQADRVDGGEVWTVVYRQGNEMRPWLYMVREMGDGWNTQARCTEVATRMNEYKEAGLTDLAIRDDASTPNQKVICAITQLTPQACPPVLTLMPEDDADETLYKVMGALQLGRDAVLQCSDADACPTTVQHRVSVRHQLAWEK